jgi:hypothetical protein
MSAAAALIPVIVAVRIMLLAEHFCLILAKNDRMDPKKAGWIIFFGRLIRSLHVPPPLCGIFNVLIGRRHAADNKD